MFQTPRLQSLKAQLAWNTTAQIIARVVSALTTFFITILIARRFGVDGFGDFIKITTYVAFFYLLADFGFNAIFLQRDSPWEDLLLLRILAGSFLVLAACLILIILPYGDTQGYTQPVRMGIILFAPTIVFTALATTGNALFQKYLRYDLSTIAVTVGSLTSLLLVFLVTNTSGAGQTIIWTTTALLVGTAVTACLSLFLTRTLERTPHSAVSLTRMQGLFYASIPLGLTLLFNLVYFRIDSVILTVTRTTAEVGVYGLAYKMFELPLVLPTFFMNALYPVMLKNENQQFRKVIMRSGVFLFLSSIIILMVMWIISPIITFVRADFIQGIDALRVLSLGLPFFFLSSLTMWTLIAKRKQILLVGIYGVSMIVNVWCNILYTPIHGYMAAAWITVGSEAVVLLLSGIAVFKILNSKSTD